MKRFEDSDFVVVWTGVSPDSQIISGWSNVCASVAEDTGLPLEDVKKALNDLDRWTITPDGGDDSRHVIYFSEFVYLCSLTIVRVLR